MAFHQASENSRSINTSNIKEVMEATWLVLTKYNSGLVACSIVTAVQQPSSERSQRRNRGPQSEADDGEQPTATAQPAAAAEPAGVASGSAAEPAGVASGSDDGGAGDSYIGRRVKKLFKGCGLHHGTVFKREANGD